MHISLVALLLGAVVAGLLFWLGKWVLGLLGLSAPFDRIALVALALICLLVFISMATGGMALPVISIR